MLSEICHSHLGVYSARNLSDSSDSESTSISSFWCLYRVYVFGKFYKNFLLIGTGILGFLNIPILVPVLLIVLVSFVALVMGLPLSIHSRFHPLHANIVPFLQTSLIIAPKVPHGIPLHQCSLPHLILQALVSTLQCLAQPLKFEQKSLYSFVTFQNLFSRFCLK